MARQCAAEGLDHVQFLARLVELELIDRERRMVEPHQGGEATVAKSLDSFDFKAIPALNKAQVLELARCEWIERRENVIALGPSGTGKTHVARWGSGWPPAKGASLRASPRPPRSCTS